ncbi:uncharacterized protein LOC118415822 isoform X2 [Branchiostoma floridae]|nr:uncharacterized protein LOC118415822 isoform X2 [Branchiostoma floridae]XP_035676557.1 uncharacterized protein LOC118415822 isoform X2 [Branchiostoma floridae]
MEQEGSVEETAKGGMAAAVGNTADDGTTNCKSGNANGAEDTKASLSGTRTRTRSSKSTSSSSSHGTITPDRPPSPTPTSQGMGCKNCTPCGNTSMPGSDNGGAAHITVYNFGNIQGSQIGHGGTLHNIQARQTSSKGGQTDETERAVDFVNSIINPGNYPNQYCLKYEDLAERFQSRHGRFKDLGVGPLKAFLQKSPHFDLVQTEAGLMVQQKFEQGTPIGEDQVDSLVNSFDLQTRMQANLPEFNDDSDLEVDFQSCYSHSLGSRSSSRVTSPGITTQRPVIFGQEPIDQGSCNWNYVRPKSRHVRHSSGGSERLSLDLSGSPSIFTSPSPCFSFSSSADSRLPSTPYFNTNISADLLDKLLHKPAGPNILFRESEVVYQGHEGQAAFMLDVVSMWNTPKRKERAFIVMGVQCKCPPPHDVIGLQDTGLDAYYQNLFDTAKCFSYKPPFRYEEFKHRDVLLGIVVIPPCFGSRYTEPCIAEDSLEHGMWHQDELWYRDGPCNAAAPSQNHAKVFTWFRDSTSPRIAKAQLKFPLLGRGEEKWESFFEAVDQFDSRRSYCLILSRCAQDTRHLGELEALAGVPWLKVFDFDQKSRVDGVLSVCEEKLKSTRGLTISTPIDSLDSLSNRSTDWFFPRGHVHKRESLVDGSERAWVKKYGKEVEAHCSLLSEFCHDTTLLTAVVLWYSDDDGLGFLNRLLMKMDSAIDPLKVVLCMPEVPKATASRELVNSIQRSLEIEKVIEIPLECVCWGLQKIAEDNEGRASSQPYQLPNAVSLEPLVVSASDACWLQRELDVLYINETFEQPDTQTSHLGDSFLRGGVLTWYEYHLSSFDARRTLYDDVLNHVKKHIMRGQSTLITLYHAPGGGGTCFARRILWDIHQIDQSVPCVFASAPTMTISELHSRLDWLHNKTHLPVVLLIDSQDSILVNRLFHTCYNVKLIILYVQRYNMAIHEKKQRGNEFWLKGIVDKDEALRLERVFAPHCNQERKHALKILTEGVAVHHVYEFGLTAYDNEYVGVSSYVKGYLDIPKEGALTAWQTAVGYLALAYFYGHIGIPRQFFAKLLGVREDLDALVTTEYLTHRGKQFVFEEDNTWRVTHHVVAKEILEQILCRQTGRHDKEGRLSENARKHLSAFACKFIKEAGVRQMKNGVASPALMRVLRDIFINRDYKAMGQDDIQRRQMMSPIITDIPPHDNSRERLAVLQALTECFPRDPNFWGHLGRFYAMCRASDEEAERCLEKALTLRQEEIRSYQYARRKEESSGDTVLCQVHHMYGILYSRRVAEAVGSKLGDFSNFYHDFDPKKQNIHDVMKKVSDLAVLARDCFTKSRELLVPGMEESFGYIGEITCRLQIVDFLQRFYPSGYFAYLDDDNAPGDVVEFLSSCFSECDHLMAACLDRCTYEDLMRNDSFLQCVNWFNVLFKNAAEALQRWEGGDSIRSRRSRIAALKIKHHNLTKQSKRTFLSLENIHSKDDIAHIIELFECTFQEVYEQNLPMDIGVEVKDWLLAIRHVYCSQTYPLENVLLQVRRWYEKSPKSPLAVYYLYVLNTVLAIGKKKQSGSSRYFAESKRLLPEMKQLSRLVHRYVKTREWLGVEDGQGIRRLVHRGKLGEWSQEQRFWKDPSKTALLEVRTGTVCFSREQLHGTIELDTGQHHSGEPLKVFFVPKIFGMFGKKFENLRVQFYIGFGIDRGCEAFNLKELQKVACTFCKTPTEVPSLGPTRTARCMKCKNVVRATGND